MLTCKECEHWGEKERSRLAPGFKACHNGKVGLILPNCPDTKVRDRDSLLMGADWEFAVTGPDFGCVHAEKKKEKTI
jgi:hypothetical protein